MIDLSIVIPAFNESAKIAQDIEGATAFLKHHQLAGEIIVVDDGSSDASVSYLERIAGIRLIARTSNGGFAAACRSGIEAAANEIIVMLNTDVRPSPDFLAPLVAGFEDPRVLAVSCLGYADDNRSHGEGAKVPYFRRGVLKLRNLLADRTCLTLYAIGGHCAVSRSKFLALGGFDELYAPFYWEDADLCYRGWKRGWITLYEPSSRVVHDHTEGAILKTWGVSRSELTYGRNSYLFVWKNISSRRMLFGRHLPNLVARLLFSFLWLDAKFYRQVFGALRRAPRARRRAKAERPHRFWSDEQIWQRLEPESGAEAPERGVAAH